MSAASDAATDDESFSFRFESVSRCRLQRAVAPRDAEPPPLLVCLHGQAQSGARQQRWMGAAVPAHFAAIFPDGFLPYEIRRPDKPVRVGYGWYLYDADRDSFLESLREAVARLWTLIDQAVERLGANPQRIWLAGFSQGAYLAHTAALHGGARVQGWVGQAGGFRADYAPVPAPQLAGTPVLIQTGSEDPAFTPQRADEVSELLAGYGARVDRKTYPVGHVIVPEMASDARRWIEDAEAALSRR